MRVGKLINQFDLRETHRLAVRFANINSKSLTELNCPRLERLLLDGNPVDLKALKSLSRLKHLNYLSIKGTGLTNSDIAELRSVLAPKVGIVSGPERGLFDRENEAIEGMSAGFFTTSDPTIKSR